MVFQGWVGQEQKSEMSTQSEKIARIIIVESVMVNLRALFELNWADRDGALGENKVEYSQFWSEDAVNWAFEHNKVEYSQRNTENTEVLAIRFNNYQNFGPEKWLKSIAGSVLVEMASFGEISAVNWKLRAKVVRLLKNWHVG